MDQVQHIPQEQRFIIQQGTDIARVSYRLFDAQSEAGPKAAVDFYSTYVPPECRGKGLAEKLVRAAIAWATDQGYELHASCWYVAKFIR